MSINTTRGYGSGTKTTTGKSANSDLESLSVTGDADVGGNATIGGNLTVSGTIAGGAYTPTSLTVSGASNLNTLTTTGTTNLASTTTSALTVTGATNVAAITASGAATLPSVTGPTTLTGNLTVTGTLTAASISGGSTGDFTVNGRLYVDEATSGNVSSNATISTYNSGSTANYIQVQTSSTNTGSGEGTLIGVDGRDFIILQRESTYDIILESETNNGMVNIRGCGLNVRPDSATDGTFSTNATIGTFRNDSTSNYLQLQNSTTGTASSVGTLVGAVNSDSTLRNLTTGSTILQTPGGTVTLDSSGDVTISGNLSVTGNTLTPSYRGSVQSVTFIYNGSVTSGARFKCYNDSICWGYDNTVELLGYVGYIDRAVSTAVVCRLTDVSLATPTYTTTTGADATFPVSTFDRQTINGSLSKSFTPSGGWTYTISAGVAASTVAMYLTIFYRVGNP